MAKQHIYVAFKDINLGVVTVNDKDNKIVYDSNTKGEIMARNKYFLPQSYEDELFGSKNKPVLDSSFFGGFVNQVKCREDLMEYLGINPDDKDIDILYKLSQSSYEGSMIKFTTDDNEASR